MARKRDITQFGQACRELDASPATILRSLRGAIEDARVAYPDILHVDVRDATGELWLLSTQDADWSPRDPAELTGRSIDDATIDARTGELRCTLSDRTSLSLLPAERVGDDDPPNWELLTPDGLALEFGPGLRWQIAGADASTTRATPGTRQPPL